VFDIDNQYMFGPSILAAPVTNEMYNKTEILPDIITSGNFFDEHGIQGGLKAEYYNDINFKNLINTQKDEKINFSWDIVYPKGINGPGFSVRWSGQIISCEEGVYKFALRSNDIAALWIDDNLVIERTGVEESKLSFESIKLLGNKKYNIRVDYAQSKPESTICLMWIKPENIATGTGTKEMTNKINVYLPEGNTWYDFWSGESFKGGITIERTVPIDIMPLYIKSGSIIPMGPKIQYSTEKPADPVELRIYEGGDAEFNIYEDENDNYNYEKGVYSIIPVTWSDKSKTLTIGKQKGKFPGMLMERIFNVVLVKENHGTGIEETVPDTTIRYFGENISMNL
jgi:alpha-D-xyloside xylohydrolase